ncbi:MAG: PAP2 family protein/DedA family protein [Microgenomates group bacterium GW2011_GWA1_Microgenomates_45_10]|nr:MAG: PAP2 family protein/DedA family protein [Microgenomates group bacterium GW2011_GWA1_Microgenomates_45_10]
MIFPNWAKNILFLLVYMISGLVLVVIIEGLLSGTELIPLNTLVERAVVHTRMPFLTTILVVITRLGDPFFLSFATALIAVLLAVRGRHYDAVLFVATLVITVISLTVLKNTFQITRPGSGLVDASGWSFPSGHATVATAFFFMLAHSFFGRLKTSGGKTFLILGSIFAVILIYFSRLYLGAHWALDVLAGAALGLLSVSFTVLVFSIFIGDKRSLKNRIS